jgi:hypothetical protein
LATLHRVISVRPDFPGAILMIGTLHANVRHFLNEQGELSKMPGPAVALAVFLRQVVGWVTMPHPSPAGRTNITCRRSPGRKRCPGEIEGSLLPEAGEIWYLCPECGDHGVITGRKGTSWDRSAPLETQTRHL